MLLLKPLLKVKWYVQSLYDTPGVHLHHRMAAAVNPEDLPLLAPRKRLAGRVISASNPSISLVGQSLFWGGIARIDILEVSLWHFELS